MYHSKIAGLGYYVPSNVVTNDDLSKIMETNDEWIQERTGIQERRHIIRGEDTTTSMGVKEAKIAIERSGVAKEDIDFVVEKVKGIVAKLRSMSPLYEDFVKKQK